jgi:hypothetical protein
MSRASRSVRNGVSVSGPVQLHQRYAVGHLLETKRGLTWFATNRLYSSGSNLLSTSELRIFHDGAIDICLGYT